MFTVFWWDNDLATYNDTPSNECPCMLSKEANETVFKSNTYHLLRQMWNGQLSSKDITGIMWTGGGIFV